MRVRRARPPARAATGLRSIGGFSRTLRSRSLSCSPADFMPPMSRRRSASLALAASTSRPASRERLAIKIQPRSARSFGPRAPPTRRWRSLCAPRRCGEPMIIQQPNSFRTGPDERGHFGLYGGRLVAETLMPLILDLERAYAQAKADPEFGSEMTFHLTHYVGRPSPLYFAERLTAHCRSMKTASGLMGAKVYLKRE